MSSVDSDKAWGHVTLQPTELVVGQYGTWVIKYTVGQEPIETGGDIRIRPYGNPLVRPPGQTFMPAEDNYVTVSAPPHVRLQLECTEWLVVTVTVQKGRLVEGDEVAIVYGDRSRGSPGFKIRAVAHDLHFRLSVKSTAEAAPVALPERPLLRLVPERHDHFLVKASSIVGSDQDIELLIRSVDRFGNTTETCPTPVYIPPIQGFTMPQEANVNSVHGSYTRVRCRRTGDLPTRRIRIAVRNNHERVVAHSNPIEANAPPEQDRIYWGDMHCHSDLEQALEPLEFVYHYARDQEKLDFIAHVEHNLAVQTRWTGKRYKTWQGGLPDVPEYNEATWEYRKELIQEYTEPGRFVPLLALEWATNLYGHMNVYYPDLDGPLLYPEGMWNRAETPQRAWEALEGQEAIIIPHHPSAPVGTGNPPHYWATSGFDWEYYEPHYMRLVEIYSKWGCSEYFGCPRPLLNQQVEGTVQAALARGYKLGFVGASDTHASRPGSDLYQDHTYSQSGLTAVFAPRLDRASIYAALKARRCYATTGQRIILRFRLNDHGMGQEVHLEDPEQLKDMFLDVATETQIQSVEVLKNGAPFYRYNGHLTPGLGWWRDNGWEMQVRVLDKELTTGTDYYYVRVLQEDGGMAWSSPIWVTVETLAA